MAENLLSRLGLIGGALDRRLVLALLALALGLYAIGWAAFPPRVATNDDEGLYIEQTRVFVDTGSFVTEKVDPLSGELRTFVPGNYPIGTVALMAPFVAAFGWRGAFVPSFLCVLIAVLATARWLQEERRSPIFALLLLAFPASLVVGRLAVSDAARMAAAAVGLWLFFRGLRGSGRAWLASGLVAGAALTLRESAVLPFIPLFAGTVLRRDRGWLWLLAGGLIGTGLHLGANQLAFGDPFFVRGASTPYRLAFDTLHERLPLYLLGLLVLVPGGLVFGLLYRGRRRPEIVATVALYFCFYLFQSYGMSSSSLEKRLVVALRYFDPLLPLLAFTMAEALPRWLDRLEVQRRALARRLCTGAVAFWIAGVLAACFLVHPVLDRWAASQAQIRDAIARHAPETTVLVANGTAVRKFIDDLSRDFVTLHRDRVSIDQLQGIRNRYGGYVIALLDRGDSAYWREDAARNQAFIEALGSPEPVVDLRVTATDRLRIWRSEDEQQ
jgi:4-amino-4-deoxy-L-arabinose transferase-like glycosyltransferase